MIWLVPVALIITDHLALAMLLTAIVILTERR